MATTPSKDKKEKKPELMEVINKKDVTFHDMVSAAHKNYGSAEDVPMLDTGSEILNVILGQKGMPRGVMIDYTAAPGIGKSTSMLFVCKALVTKGHVVCYLDVEKGVNDSQLDGIGLTSFKYHPVTNPNGKFFLFDPATFEDADNLFEMFIKMNPAPALVVMDSITNLIPTKLIGIPVESVEPALDARLTGALLKKFKNAFRKKEITLVMINQVRVKLNFNRPSTVEGAGGWAYKHACDISVKIDPFKKVEKVIKNKGGEDETYPYGSIVKIYNIKNRYSPPYRSLHMAIIFGKGVSNVYSYRIFLEKRGHITTGGGGWYQVDIYGDGKPFKSQGSEAVDKYLANNVTRVKELVKSYGGFKFDQATEEAPKEDPINSLPAHVMEVTEAAPVQVPQGLAASLSPPREAPAGVVPEDDKPFGEEIILDEDN